MNELAETVFESVRGFVLRSMEPISAAIAQLAARIKTLEDRPAAKDGAPGAPGQRGEPGENGAPGAPGSNGKSAYEIAVERGFHGSELDWLGSLRGKDADRETIREEAERAAALLPRPADGRDGRDGAPGQKGADGMIGKDGRDGMTLENFGVEVIGRTFRFTLSAADGRTVIRDVTVPIPLDAGTFKAGQSYEAGDMVTYGGSLWIAQRSGATDSPPSDSWRLAVKRGKDGKDAS